MKSVFFFLTACVLGVFVLVTASPAHAQCSQICVTQASISPGTIPGDQSELATVTATVHIGTPSSETVLIAINEQHFGSSLTICNGGHLVPGGCNYGVMGPGNVTVSFSLNGNNYTGNTENGTINVSAMYENDSGQNVSITVTSVPNPQEPPSQDPDGPCSTCGNAGNPINVTNGDTWISQQDYLMPGIGSAFTLTRTWNSLWANMNPPEESGIFGDSWRSNFEERIQTLSGGVVKYWKGNGSSLFYTYNSSTNAYILTAPTDDQTTLSFSSSTTLWTVMLKNGTQKIFNNAGYLTSIVDLNGNTTTINVDATHQNRIASVTDPSGHVLTFNYNNNTFPRLCTSVTDSIGTFTQYFYDTSGRLTEVLYPDGSQYNFQFNDPNSNTLISRVTDSQGKTIEAHTYDSQRRGTSSQQANDSNGNPVNKVTVSYGAGGYPYQNDVCASNGSDCVIVEVSNRAQRHYISSTTGGAAGNACATCDFSGISAMTFSDSGYMTSAKDANGNTTLYQYDNQGNLISKSLPDYFTGFYDTWNYSYNSLGEVLSVTDPLGVAGDPNHTTTYTYDARGNLTSVTTPSPDGMTAASVTYFTPNAQGQITQIQDPLNNTTTITYCTQNQNNCPYGLIYTIEDAQSNTTTYSYDGRGNRLSVTDAANNETQFQYDAMNRVTQITYPTSPATTVQFHYNWRGRRDYVIDQNNNKTIYAYDDADRLISVTDAQTPTAGVTKYAYDTENDLTDIWDANNNHTQFVYNIGRTLKKTVFPSGLSETYVWDYNNNLTSKADRNSHTISYSYDYQNHLQKKTYSSSSITYTYDPAARLTQVQDTATGTYTFGYDNMNRLTSTGTNYTFDSAGNYTVQYGYDAASNRNSMSDPQNVGTSYGYDTLNRLTSLVYNRQNPGFSFGYDTLSRRTSLTRPNGVTTSYAYDSVSRLTSILHQLGGTTLDGAAYTYDNAGNRVTRTDERLVTTLNYSYDNIYQLLRVTQGASTTESYTYDLIGNRLSSLGVSPYQYNSSNELTSTPTLSYTYDNNGSTKTKSDGTQYTWDYENRLTQMVLPGSGGTVNFKYDPFGRRVQKSFTQGSTTTTTNYLYDGDSLLEELDQSGNVLARYTQGPPLLDEPLSELRSGTTSYYEQDGLRTVTSLSNSSGGLANTFSYDSFGKLIASTGTLANPFQYTGREFDSETGVYYYRARYYDQSVGRFLSEDLLKGVSDSVNFYAYVQNNPANLIDPSGLSPECACAPAKRLRLVPISDCHHGSSRRIVYELQGPGASGWWVTEHQNPPSWAPATPGSPAGQSTDENGFDDTIYGWSIGRSYQDFTISRQDPRKSPNTPSCPVDVSLPSGPNRKNQDYRTLGIFHGNPIFINGNSTGWVPCNTSYEVPGYEHRL